MQLKYVVVTSVDRDDLKDSGAGHFAACIQAVRKANPTTTLEVLVPDFRGRMDIALSILADTPPDVFNHNLETVPRLYKKARPGADYEWSLDLLARYKSIQPDVQTKSGLMLGLGTFEEVVEVMKDCRRHNVDMLTLGQYCNPAETICRLIATSILMSLKRLLRKQEHLVLNEWRAAHWFARPIKRISRRLGRQSVSLSPASAAIWFLS